MQPYIHGPGVHANILWNVDCSVGKGGQNSKKEDVFYIQWYYRLASKHMQTPPERRVIYGAVKLTGSCNGSDGDPLVRAITVHQRAINHPHVDGRVSVARGEGKIGGYAFFVLRLGARLAHMHSELWPRLDKMPECPGPVAEAVRRAIPRLPTE